MPEQESAGQQYYWVYSALIALTLTTWGMAFVDLGAFSMVVALTIAAAKATLVGLYFMHVRFSDRLIRIVIVAALFWLGILLGLTMSDYLTRQ